MRALASTAGSGGRIRGPLGWAALLLALLALHTLWLAAADAHSATAKETDGARTHVVEIRQFKYFPATLEVKAGDTITWKNLDAAPHTATAKGWDSGRLNRGQSWTLKVTGKGTIEYICVYHPAMKGKVVVK